MPRVASLTIALIVAVLVGPGTPAPAAASASPPASAREGTVDAGPRADATDRWIVVYGERDAAEVAAADARAKGRGIAADRSFRHALKGFAAKLTPGQLAATRADPSVRYVVRDEVISMQAQQVPRGIRRTETTRNPLAAVNGVDERVDADVAIFDTGIDRDHEDLNVAGGRNCTSSSTGAWGDGNGHGTHVAGTVGALDNGLGVVGVAPGVRLWSVRILNSEGSGLVSWYVCGIDWLTAQREPDPSSTTGGTRPVIEAVNMSVAKRGADDLNCGLTNKDLIHQAICRLVASGVTVVAAAGNDGFDARRLIPASYNEVITVSALADMDGKPGAFGGSLCYSWGTYDRDDTYADFSNYGSDVDLIAPGKCTWSSLPGDRYGFVSGTSMAAPHVAGAAALYLASRPGATPAQVRAALMNAGTYEWSTSTDPDSRPDRLLNVGNLVAPDGFQVDLTPHIGWVNRADASVALPVRLFRGEAVADEVTLAVEAESPIEATVDPVSLAGAGGSAATVVLTIPPATPSGTYDVKVTATLGGRTRSVATSIKVDADKPVAKVPTVSIPTLSVFETRSFRARASWAAATDVTAGVTAYQVQWRVDGGSWSSSTTVAGSVRSVERTFATRSAYEVRLRARDAAGNYGAWMAVAAPYTSVVLQDTSATLERASGWWRSTNRAMSGGSVLASGAQSSWISRTFTGRAVSWVGVLGPARGRAHVYIDGTRVTTVDLHRGSTHYRRVVFSRSWSTSGEHTIRIVVHGTAGHPRVDLDALVVLK